MYQIEHRYRCDECGYTIAVFSDAKQSTDAFQTEPKPGKPLLIDGHHFCGLRCYETWEHRNKTLTRVAKERLAFIKYGGRLIQGANRG